MSNRIQELIQQHIRERRGGPFMATVLDEWNDGDLLDALEIPHRVIRKMAYSRIQKLFPNTSLSELIIKGLCGSSSVKIGLLLTLSALPIEEYTQFEEAVIELLNDEDREVRSAAARVIAFRYPRNISALLQMQSQPGFSEILRHLCYSGQVEWLHQIAVVAGYPNQRLPPAIGVLVDQYWLAANAEKHPQLVAHLAEECGFSELAVNESVIRLWSEGLSCVTKEMMREDSRGWRERNIQIGWDLLPENYSISDRTSISVDIHDPVDRALFLSAIRDADRSQISFLRSRDPFSIQFSPKAANVICCHAKLCFAEQLFIDRAAQLAQELQVPQNRESEFYLDHARTRLILNTDDQAESESILRAKWKLRSTGVGTAESINIPVISDDDFREAKHIVLQNIPQIYEDQRFSEGTNSVINLANSANIEGIEDWIFEVERKWKPYLIPIGMELQVPMMNANHIIAWKQALRFLGVNSPRRPEYHKMTEAAFLPVPTFHAAVLGPLMLHRIGMIEYAQDMAMHLSFQGDLGEDVRFLAFPQLFIHPSQRSRKRSPWSITPLMSKGLVNLNHDVVNCDQDMSATCRTEVRVFRCVVEDQDTLLLNRDYIDDVVSNHILASAIKLDCQKSSQYLHRFFERVEAFATELGPDFVNLLEANYYEATGEPDDVHMLDYLPIHALRGRVKEQFSKHTNAKMVEQRLLQLRTDCVRQVVRLWFGKQSHGLMFDNSSCKIRLPPVLD